MTIRAMQLGTIIIRIILMRFQPQTREILIRDP